MNGGVAIDKPVVEPPPASDGLPETSASQADQAAALIVAPRRGGRGFSAVCAMVAVAAACVALAAPWLRPRLDADARRWLGDGNIVSRLVSAEPAAAAHPAVPAAIDEASLRTQLAGYDQRIRALSQSLATMRDEQAHAVAALQASTAGNAALSAAIDGLNRRADRLQSADAVVAARVRASNLLALAVALRRDVDAGVSIERDCTALKAIGPYPVPVDHALRELVRLAAGIPTMRDLAETFGPVQTRLEMRAAGSSFSRGWARVKSWFAPAPQDADDVLLEHVRALVADGRFSETANVLQASEWAPIAANWGAMVRARATAVVATQIILRYALDATEAAYATDDGAPTRGATP